MLICFNSLIEVEHLLLSRYVQNRRALVSLIGWRLFSFFAAISTSFWEEVTHSGGGSLNLFGTAPPLVDTRIHLSKPLYHAITLDHQGTWGLIVNIGIMVHMGKNFLRGEFNILSPDSSGSDSNGSSSEYSKQHGERYKRRRMLHFAGSRTEGIVPGSPSYVNVLGSPTTLQSSLRVGPLYCLSQSLTNNQVTIFQEPG